MKLVTSIMSAAVLMSVSPLMAVDEASTQPEKCQVTHGKTVNESTPKTVNESTPKIIRKSTPKIVNESSPKAVNGERSRIVNESTPKSVNKSTPKVLTMMRGPKCSTVHPETASDKQ